MCRCGWQFGGTSVFFSSWKEKHKEFEREVIKNWWRDSNISPSSPPSVKKYLKNAKRFKNLISFPPVIPFLFTWSLVFHFKGATFSPFSCWFADLFTLSVQEWTLQSSFRPLDFGQSLALHGKLLVLITGWNLLTWEQDTSPTSLVVWIFFQQEWRNAWHRNPMSLLALPHVGALPFGTFSTRDWKSA